MSFLEIGLFYALEFFEYHFWTKCSILDEFSRNRSVSCPTNWSLWRAVFKNFLWIMFFSWNSKICKLIRLDPVSMSVDARVSPIMRLRLMWFVLWRMIIVKDSDSRFQISIIFYDVNKVSNWNFQNEFLHSARKLKNEFHIDKDKFHANEFCFAVDQWVTQILSLIWSLQRKQPGYTASSLTH